MLVQSLSLECIDLGQGLGVVGSKPSLVAVEPKPILEVFVPLKALVVASNFRPTSSGPVLCKQ